MIQTASTSMDMPTKYIFLTHRIENLHGLYSPQHKKEMIKIYKQITNKLAVGFAKRVSMSIAIS
jgi:hypothetical protein